MIGCMDLGGGCCENHLLESWQQPQRPFLMDLPKGSKDPNDRVLGPKYYSINGILALKPYYLGPWTLRIKLYLAPGPVNTY